jgi:WD40 repeat protein/tRNA A-37 threonylcarbamoyl transferase component Bud32/tetratricopeptide (TPR) repeat protein
MNEPHDTLRVGKRLPVDDQPDVRDYLARTENINAAELVELICGDQMQRWQQGERVPIEAYLGLHPILASDSGMAFELVYAEFLLREHLGESPSLSEYQWRFPQFAERLRRQVELHQALDFDVDGDESDSSPERTAHTNPHAAPATGRGPVVPGYEVLEELGRGGMGIVYKARHLELNRLVALKVLRDGAVADGEENRRFRREAELVARMAHPNIVPIYEVGEYQGMSYLALEYVEGGSLKQKLAGTPQEPRLAAELVQTLARAVHHAHERGVIHRDLNPSNVLIADCGLRIADSQAGSQSAVRNPQSAIVKITDFGLAKQLAGDHGQTRTGTMVGTPCYMSPEQARGHGNEIGPATDVYALGAILYEMLTGQPPFRGPNVLETVTLVATAEPVRPRAIQPSVPRDLEIISLKCLRKLASRRYTSAQGLADDLERWLAGEPIKARRVGELERAWLWARRKPGLASALAAAVLALVAGSVASAWFGMDARQQAFEAQRQKGDAVEARDQANEAAQKASRAQNSAETARDAAKSAEAKANLRAAEQTYRLGLQQAQAGAVDRGLFLMLNAWRQAPPEAGDFRRVVRANLAGWSRQLPRLRQALRMEAAEGHGHMLIAPGDPEGRTILTGLRGRPVHCWDTATGRPVARPVILGPGHFLNGSSPDGRWLAMESPSGGYVVERATNRSIHVDHKSWQKHGLESPPERGTVPVFEDLPEVAISVPDSDDGVRWFWDLRNGKALPVRLQLQQNDAFRLTRCSDGREFLLVFRDRENERRVVVVELGTGKQHVLTPTAVHDVPELSLTGSTSPSISYDGRLAMVLSDDAPKLPHWQGKRLVSWWDLSTGRPVGTAWQPRFRSRLGRLRRDSLEMLSEGIDDRYRLYDLASGLQRGGDVPAIAWPASMGKTPGGVDYGTRDYSSEYRFSGSEDGRLVFTLDPGGIARIWDTSLGRLQTTANANPRESSRAFKGWMNENGGVYSPDRRLVVLTHRSQPYATLLDARTGKVLGTPRQPYLEHAAFSPDGRYLATATSGIPGEVRVPMVVLRDARTGEPVSKPWLSPKLLHALAFSPDGKTLAAGGVAGAFLLDVPSNTLRHRLFEKTCICDLKFDSTGRRLVTVAAGGWTGVGAGLRVWDVGTGKPLGPFRADNLGSGGGGPAASWHAGTGELVAFEASASNLIRLSADGKTVLGGPWHTGPVRLATFSDDGRRLAACTSGNNVRQWDTRTGELVGLVLPQSGVVRLIRYSPDGKLLVVVGNDGNVRLWDAATGWPLGPPLLHHSLPADLSFADEGRTLLTVTLAGTVRAWPVPQPVQGGTDGPERFNAWMGARGGVRSVNEEAIPLSPEEWQAASAILAKRWPQNDPALEVPADEISWHRARALDAAETGNERAELYHLTRLAGLCPKEAGLHGRMARVHARVAARLPAGLARQREWQLAWAARKRDMGWPGEVEADRLGALEAAHHQRWDEALWYLDGLTAHRRGDWRAWADRADVHGRLGDKVKRDRDFQQALARGGVGDRDFMLTLTDVWAREDRWGEVIGALSEVTKIGKAELGLLRRLALAQLKAGDRVGHAGLCQALLRTLPPKVRPEIAQTLAEICALSPTTLNDWGRPLALAQNALRWTESAERKAGSEEERDWARSLRRICLRTRAAVLHRGGRHAKAISVLKEAMKLAPGGQGEAVEWAWLALAYARAEKPKEAQEWLNRVRQAAPKRDGDGLWEAVLVEVLIREARECLLGQAVFCRPEARED